MMDRTGQTEERAAAAATHGRLAASSRASGAEVRAACGAHDSEG
jgi:hypothetical protein